MAVAEPLDHVGSFRAEFIAQSDGADRGAVAFDQHDSRASGLEPFDVRGEGGGIDVAGLADTHLGVAEAAGEPGADVGGHLVGITDIGCGGDDRGGERMVTGPLEGCR